MANRCPECGKFLSAKDTKCPNCGAILKQEAKKPAPIRREDLEVSYELKKNDVVKDAPRIIKKDAKPIIINRYKNVYVNLPPDFSGPSYFDGRWIQLVGWTLLGFLVSVVTLGICFPLAYGWIVRWEVNHTVVNGYRQYFDGKPGSLIPRWILWMFLTIITLTIFSWFIPIKLRRWKVARIKFLDGLDYYR